LAGAVAEDPPSRSQRPSVAATLLLMFFCVEAEEPAFKLASDVTLTPARLQASVKRGSGKGVDSMVASGVVVCLSDMWQSLIIELGGAPLAARVAAVSNALFPRTGEAYRISCIVEL
jgi:hypothetical protein